MCLYMQFNMQHIIYLHVVSIFWDSIVKNVIINVFIAYCYRTSEATVCYFYA